MKEPIFFATQFTVGRKVYLTMLLIIFVLFSSSLAAASGRVNTTQESKDSNFDAKALIASGLSHQETSGEILTQSPFTPHTPTDDWVWQNPLPQGNELLAVWGSRKNDVFAVGRNGTILHFDGNVWEVMESGTNLDLWDIWGSSGNNVYAVGGTKFSIEEAKGVLLHFDGNRWSILIDNLAYSLRGVWGTSETNIYVVGGDAYEKFALQIMLHYDGQQWIELRKGQGGVLYDVWGSSESDVYAVGTEHFHYNGSEWENLVIGGSGRTVWGSSASDVFIASPGAIHHYDGISWTLKKIFSYPYTGIWGANGSEVFFTAEDGYLEHYNGESWTNVDLDYPWERWEVPWPNHNGIWGSGSNDIYVVGSYGRILHFNGSSWTAIFPGTDPDLRRVWGTSKTDVFAVGQAGSIWHYDGKIWTPMESGTKWQLNDIWGSGPTDVFAVGEFGTVLHYDGLSWTEMHNGNHGWCGSACNLMSVWGSSGNDFFVGSSYNIIWHYNGSTWNEMKITIDQYNIQFTDIWGTSASNVYALGNVSVFDQDQSTYAKIWHYNGSGWSELIVPWEYRLQLRHYFGIDGLSSDSIYFLQFGQILHYNGKDFSTYKLPRLNGYDSISVLNDKNIFATGGSYYPGKNILHYDGITWSYMESGSSLGWLNLWGTSENGVFAVGRGGTILYNEGNINSSKLPLYLPLLVKNIN